MTDEFPHPVIKHVIYIMLENRGFDHFMGWLYPQPQPDEAPDYRLVSYEGDFRPFMGLSDDRLGPLKNPYPPALNRPAQPIIKGARSPKTPSYNPGEHFPHIMNQMWGRGEDKETWTDPQKRGPLLARLKNSGAPPPMNGYILDYEREMHHAGVATPNADQLSEIVETYLPEQLPVLSGLAKAFAVSDEWYCSVPSQTNTNRAFSLTGSSRGMVNNGFYTPDTKNPQIIALEKAGKSLNTDSLPVSTGSLFETLQAAGYSWKVFWQSEWPPRYLAAGIQWQYTRVLVPALLDPQFDANFVKFNASDPQNTLFETIRSGQLPALTYIEPKWGGGASWDAKMRLVGNEFHPVSDTSVAEDFLNELYVRLAGSSRANDTLLVITFDENGGTYDHVVPPPAPSPGNESVPLPHAPWDHKDLYNAIDVALNADNDYEVTTDPMTRTQYGFNFKSYGIRVPTILVSPNIPPQTVFRSPEDGKVFDHTSIIASIFEFAGIDRRRWLLGERVAGAPTFTHLFDEPPERLNKPAKPFSFEAMRSNGVNVQAGFPYRLAYLGSLWPRPGNPQFLGPPRSGSFASVTGYYYPVLTDEDHAALYTLSPLTSNASGVISNMSNLCIQLADTALGAKNSLRVHTDYHNAYFGTPGTSASDGGTWQIRLLQSRDSQDEIRIGDYVAFFSCLPPRKVSTLSDLTTPDPLQRLLPDAKNASYLTSAAGDWALWQILAP